jgi:D-lactate dehydrogenase
MKVAFFSAKDYDRVSFQAVTAIRHEVLFLEAHLDSQTAALAAGCGAVCAFVNDHLDAPALDVLARLGVRLIVLRSAGFNNVDLARAKELGLVVARVPAYSPYAVAEHAVALLLALDRKLPRAYARTLGVEYVEVRGSSLKPTSFRCMRRSRARHATSSTRTRLLE